MFDPWEWYYTVLIRRACCCWHTGLEDNSWCLILLRRFLMTLSNNVITNVRVNCAIRNVHFTHLPPSDAYMRQWTGSSLVQVMACCLFGDKPLPEPMLIYCWLDLKEQTRGVGVVCVCVCVCGGGGGGGGGGGVSDLDRRLCDHIIKTHVRGFFDIDLHEVSWHFATHEAVRPSGF